MSEQTSNASENAPATPEKAKRTRSKNVPDTVHAIAVARVRKRLGARASQAAIDARVGDEKKVVRGQLRSTQWAALVKASPKSYGPRGSVKREPNDRRPWGTIPAAVAKEMVK